MPCPSGGETRRAGASLRGRPGAVNGSQQNPSLMGALGRRGSEVSPRWFVEWVTENVRGHNRPLFPEAGLAEPAHSALSAGVGT